jgi:hypothetical protein
LVLRKEAVLASLELPAINNGLPLEDQDAGIIRNMHRDYFRTDMQIKVDTLTK